LTAAARPFPFPSEPRWQPRACLRPAELPPGLSQWLLDPGSLTRRLRGACSGRFRVGVLGEYWARPLRSEAQRLGVEPGRYVWTREVQLFCDAQPWVFARTVIPAATLRGRGQRLKRLGDRPLGEILFTDPGARRGAVQIARITPGQRLHRRAFGALAEAPAAIWGRRSLFRIDGRPLLVCEIFLPGLPSPGPTDNRSVSQSL
jgi:chorismate--pyruvate lyase